MARAASRDERGLAGCRECDLNNLNRDNLICLYLLRGDKCFPQRVCGCTGDSRN
jgi:hypothetical protein